VCEDKDADNHCDCGPYMEWVFGGGWGTGFCPCSGVTLRDCNGDCGGTAIMKDIPYADSGGQVCCPAGDSPKKHKKTTWGKTYECPCSTDSDCWVNEVCSSGQCITGGTGVISAGDITLTLPADSEEDTPCKEDSQCEPGYHCSSSFVCHQECSESADCGEGSTYNCFNGRCF